ncbi:hypothetical protein ACHAW6_000376 [Cyclotella cf. meneghiniana]
MKPGVTSWPTASGVAGVGQSSTSASTTSSAKILEQHTKEKKDKYEVMCLEHQRDFTLLVYSVDGMVSKDARMAERQVAWLTSSKRG